MKRRTTFVAAILSLCLPVVRWLTLGVVALALNLRAAAATSPREHLSLNSDWRFIKGDPADSGDLSYANLKPWFLCSANVFVVTGTPTPRPTSNLAASVSHVQPGFDDSTWRSLTLPHDWGVEGHFDQRLDGANGRLSW